MNMLGKWALTPELCHYQVGETPDKATYEITRDGDVITFAITWTLQGQDAEVSFTAPADGSVEPADDDMPAHRLIPVSDDQLDGEAMGDDKVIATASRKVSADGQFLSVLQVNAVGTEQEHRIFQVYRRIS